jgi:polysaccharide export outer membrane protein
MKQIASHLALFLWLGLLAGPLAAQSQTKGSSYRLGPRDLIEVRVFEVDELNVERRVSEAGTVNLPLIGEVAVGGLTEGLAAQAVKEKLEAKLLQRASVSVQVREFRARPISVIGAVRQPGELEFSGRWTLLEALTAAGGVGENRGKVLYVMRRSDNGLSDQVAIDVDELVMRANPKLNIPIFANDIINVPVAVPVTVYCLGEVARPGALSFKNTDRLTLLTAIAQAGGLTDRAANRILIKRREGAGPGGEVAVDYKRIVAGKDPDVELREGDVIVVKESFF